MHRRQDRSKKGGAQPTSVTMKGSHMGLVGQVELDGVEICEVAVSCVFRLR